MKKVLVLDDRLLSGGDLSKRFTELGYEVVLDVSSADGLAERVERAAPDIIVMSAAVFDAAHRTIARPILVIDGKAKGGAIGAVAGYLMKPLLAAEIVPAVELAVSGFAELISLKKENDALKKTLEARKIIERAKGLLMKNYHISEAEAFSLMQKKSMDLRKPMVDIAQAIVLSEEITKQKAG